MKVTFEEWEMGASFNLIPETPEEVSQIARLAANVSSEKPEVSFYFSGKPYGSVWIKKVKTTVQTNSITKRIS